MANRNVTNKSASEWAYRRLDRNVSKLRERTSEPEGRAALSGWGTLGSTVTSDPERLANCADVRLKASCSGSDIVTAVHGQMTAHHRFC